MIDGLVKSPYAAFHPSKSTTYRGPRALRCILRHSHPIRLRLLGTPCGVQQVRLIPQDLRALPMNFLRNRLFSVLLTTFYVLLAAYGCATTGDYSRGFQEGKKTVVNDMEK